MFEVYASLGRDPLTGKYRQISRYFHGSFKDAKVERAALVLEVNAGKFTARRVTVDELVPEWLDELERKNRSVTTIDEYERRYRRDIRPAIGSVDVSKVTTKMLTDLYAAHSKRGAAPNSVREDSYCRVVDDDAGLPVGASGRQPGDMGRSADGRTTEGCRTDAG